MGACSTHPASSPRRRGRGPAAGGRTERGDHAFPHPRIHRRAPGARGPLAHAAPTAARRLAANRVLRDLFGTPFFTFGTRSGPPLDPLFLSFACGSLPAAAAQPAAPPPVTSFSLRSPIPPNIFSWPPRTDTAAGHLSAGRWAATPPSISRSNATASSRMRRTVTSNPAGSSGCHPRHTQWQGPGPVRLGHCRPDPATA